MPVKKIVQAAMKIARRVGVDMQPPQVAICGNRLVLYLPKYPPGACPRATFFRAPWVDGEVSAWTCGMLILRAEEYLVELQYARKRRRSTERRPQRPRARVTKEKNP